MSASEASEACVASDKVCSRVEFTSLPALSTTACAVGQQPAFHTHVFTVPQNRRTDGGIRTLGHRHGAFTVMQVPWDHQWAAQGLLGVLQSRVTDGRDPGVSTAGQGNRMGAGSEAGVPA